jgi:hypothetical protein
MSFELTNVGDNYNQCMQSCFAGQIGCNLEVCVDDIVMKTWHSDMEEYEALANFVAK